MRTRRTSRENTKIEIDGIVSIVILVIIVIIQILGDYCNRHAEEHRKASWERFERRNEEIMHMVKW